MRLLYPSQFLIGSDHDAAVAAVIVVVVAVAVAVAVAFAVGVADAAVDDIVADFDGIVIIKYSQIYGLLKTRALFLFFFF